MAEAIWSQDVFSKGELSPLMYSRVTVDAYYKGLKTANNVITYPQGASGKRFGTIYLNEITGVTSYDQIFFSDFQYYSECCYLLVFIPDAIQIYLEGILIATVSSTGIPASVIPTMDSTVLGNKFRVTTSITSFKPHDLVRSSAAANVITAVFTATTITLTTPVTAGLILPVRFTTAGTLPVTSPQIRTGKTYFLYTTSTTTAEIYSTAPEAKARLTPYAITGATVGVSNAFIANTWTFAAAPLKNLPFFDFDGGYDSITFAPAAVSGNGVIVTMSGTLTAPASMTSKYIGGVLISNGGIGRIVAVGSPTQFTIDIVQNFASTVATPGSLSFLAEPAWSDTRGWPTKCSSFQSRAVFANSDSLPNGIWLSVVNNYNDFYDLEPDDDFAISRYPSSDNVNFIRFIVPYRSLTIHSNSGVYSTPLANDQAITPKTFSMSLQDSTPATAVEPRAIDNQIVVLSGNDVHSLLWDGFNAAYTSTIASVANEHLIRNPIDEIEYLDLSRAGSRYVFIINADGTMAIFQTLISENVQGFTPASLYQSYGNAYFRWGASSPDGRCWFVTERQIAVASTPVAITAFTSSTLTAVATNFSTTEPTQAMFATTGSLPVSSPQIAVSTYYWIIGVTADTFKVYTTKADALADENAYVFTGAGVNTTVIPWPLTTKFYIEELSFSTYVDCAVTYSGTAVSSLASLPRFNGQEVLINGDGFGFADNVSADTVELIAHGSSVTASVIQAGFPINVEMQSLPVAPTGASGAKSSGFIFSQHVRLATLTFADTVGGYVNGQPITMNIMSQTLPGDPPTPTTGSMQISIMKGWSDYLTPAINITHSAPFDIKLTGIFYKIEV